MSISSVHIRLSAAGDIVQINLFWWQHIFCTTWDSSSPLVLPVSQSISWWCNLHCRHARMLQGCPLWPPSYFPLHQLLRWWRWIPVQPLAQHLPLLWYFLCLFTFVHDLALMSPFLFSFRNIRDANAFFLSLSGKAQAHILTQPGCARLPRPLGLHAAAPMVRVACSSPNN